MALQLPAAFEKSYKDFRNYPENIIYRTTYIGALKSRKARLDDTERKLFALEGANNAIPYVVPFRDLSQSGQRVSLLLLCLESPI